MATVSRNSRLITRHLLNSREWCVALIMVKFFVDRVAAGTAHGFGLFDYAQKKEVTSRCTLNPDGKLSLNFLTMKCFRFAFHHTDVKLSLSLPCRLDWNIRHPYF